MWQFMKSTSITACLSDNVPQLLIGLKYGYYNHNAKNTCTCIEDWTWHTCIKYYIYIEKNKNKAYSWLLCYGPIKLQYNMANSKMSSYTVPIIAVQSPVSYLYLLLNVLHRSKYVGCNRVSTSLFYSNIVGSSKLKCPLEFQWKP